MLEKLKIHIDNNFSFLKDKKLLIAISGGVDSVVLTNLLKQLNFNIGLAHCNFKLRGVESDLDEAFIKELGLSLKIDVHSTEFETKKHAIEHKLSIQLSARKLRYNYFEELTKKYHFDYVLTAHHADDNLETFLINLSRGTGLDGLTGIPSQNGNIIRPLLIFSRDEILNFAKKNNIIWREDASNTETKYVRNKIRHQVIPILKEINSSLLHSFNKTSKHLQQSHQIIEDAIFKKEKEIITEHNGVKKLNINKILELNNPNAYLYYFLKDYGFTEWKNIYDLLHSQSGKLVKSQTHQLLKNRDFLLLSQNVFSNSNVAKVYKINKNSSSELTEPLKISFENTTELKVGSKKTILVDKNLLIYPLLIRRWKEGDFFYPTGMLGKKKLSKYFKDEKFSLLDKKNIWLLCDNEDNIIWIIGKRQDRRFEINKNTKSIIRIRI